MPPTETFPCTRLPRASEIAPANRELNNIAVEEKEAPYYNLSLVSFLARLYILSLISDMNLPDSDGNGSRRQSQSDGNRV